MNIIKSFYKLNLHLAAGVMNYYYLYINDEHQRYLPALAIVFNYFFFIFLFQSAHVVSP